MEIIKAFISISHTVTASLSLILGAVVLFGKKGTPRHQKLGIYYFWLMIFTNVSALFIYNLGKFFFPHWLAIVTLAVLLPGLIITRFKTYKHWLKVHIIFMVISYYMLIGGAINELFLHTPSLRPYIINNHPIIGICQMIAQIIFIILLIYFLRKFRLKKN